MPTNKTQDGRSFADLAGEINDKYKDQFDPISQNGKRAELTDLRDAHEIARAKKFQEDYSAANMSKLKAFGGELLNGVNPVKKLELPSLVPDNLGMDYDIDKQVSAELAIGEKIDEYKDRDLQAELDAVSKMPGGPNAPKEINLDTSDLRYAPVLMNALNMFGKKPEQQVAPVNTASTSAAQFRDVDMSGLKRDVTNQDASVARDLERTSGGNAGSYSARRLMAGLNSKKAMAQANIAKDQQQTDIDRLQAAENARVDSFDADVQAQNNRMQFATDDVNARNQAASDNIKQQSMAAIGTSLGNIGKEDMMRDMVGASTGYYWDNKNKRFTKQPKAYGGYLLSKLKKKK